MASDTQAAAFCEQMRDAVNTAVATLKEELLGELRAAKSVAAVSQALRNLSVRNGDVITWNMTVNNKQVYTMEAVAGYIFAEMLTNYSSLVVTIIGALNEEARNMHPVPPSLLTQMFSKIESYGLWAYKVGPRKGGDNSPIIGEWDHKKHIRKYYGDFTHDSKTKLLYNYDIWSNIHYGFVGTAACFTAWELTTGAAVANLASSWGKSLIRAIRLPSNSASIFGCNMGQVLTSTHSSRASATARLPWLHSSATASPG